MNTFYSHYQRYVKWLKYSKTPQITRSAALLQEGVER